VIPANRFLRRKLATLLSRLAFNDLVSTNGHKIGGIAYGVADARRQQISNYAGGYSLGT